MRGKRGDLSLRFARDTEGNWVDLPLSMLMQTAFFGGYKGSGKTTAMKKLFEAAHEGGAQCVSVAPLGKWWSLRIARNGRGRGLKGVVVFGGEYGDVPITPGGGRVIARAVHEKKLHAVLDVELMRKDDRAVFLADFFEELMVLRKRGRHGAMVVFLDETQAVAPQKSSGREVERLRVLLGDFARECRNFSCGLIMSAQRSASVDKELIALCDMLIVMRTIHHLDRTVYEKWIDEKGDGDAEAGMWLRKLRKLGKGEAYLYAPEQNVFRRVVVEMIRTFDATKTATIGERVARVGKLGKLDVKRISAELSELVERAVAENPATLKAEIAKLKERLSAEQQNNKNVREVYEAKRPKPAKVDKRALRRLEKARAQIDKALGDIKSAVTKLAPFAPFKVSLSSDAQLSPPKLNALTPLVHAQRNGVQREHPVRNREEPVRVAKAESSASAGGSIRRGSHPEDDANSKQYQDEMRAKLGKGERIVMRAIAQTGTVGAGRDQLSVVTGYKRSTRDAYVFRLIGAGYAEELPAGDVVATNAGIEWLGVDFKPLPTGDALREHWLQKLPSGESHILTMLTEAYPSSLQRETIGEKTGFKRSTRDAYVYRLIKRRLVSEHANGGIVASGELFS